MDTKYFIEKFYEKYGNRNDKPVLFFSPGRVNLIDTDKHFRNQINEIEKKLKV